MKQEIKQLTRTALPTIVQFTAQPTFLIIDSAVVGHLLGKTSLAGLSLAVTVVGALIGLFVFLSFITNSTVSRSLGAGKKLTAVKQGVDGIYLASIIGFGIFLALFFFPDAIVDSIFNAPPDVRTEAITFLKWTSIGMPGGVIIMATNGFLRAFNKTKMLSKFSIVFTSLNVVFNLFFIIVMQMQIAGSAFGTGLAWDIQGIGQLVPVVLIVRQNGGRWRMSKSGLFSSVKEGLPMMIRTAVLWIALLLQPIFISRLGTEALAGTQIISTVWEFALIGITGIEVTLQTHLAKKLGAGDLSGAKFTLRAATRLGFGFSLVLGTLLIIFCFVVPLIFTSDYSVVEYAAWGLFEGGIVFYYTFYAFVMDGAYVAAKDTTFQCIAVIICVAIFVPTGFFVASIVPHNPFGLMITWLPYDVIVLGGRGLIGHWRRRQDRWMWRFKEK